MLPKEINKSTLERIKEYSRQNLLPEVTIYTIPINPVALQRARHTNKGITYDPQKEIKEQYRQIILNQRTHEFKDSSIPLLLNVTFFMAIPKSLSHKKQLELNGKYHTCKKDLDNLLKFISDCLTGILIPDDAQIAKIISSKLYSQDARTEFSITAL